jgi:hypothetical protein
MLFAILAPSKTKELPSTKVRFAGSVFAPSTN